MPRGSSVAVEDDSDPDDWDDEGTENADDYSDAESDEGTAGPSSNNKDAPQTTFMLPSLWLRLNLLDDIGGLLAWRLAQAAAQT